VEYYRAVRIPATTWMALTDVILREGGQAKWCLGEGILNGYASAVLVTSFPNLGIGKMGMFSL